MGKDKGHGKGFFEIKFKGPDGTVFDIADHPWMGSKPHIVNFDLLEDEARKLISARRFAFMGPAGDGVTYRENRRAFNDYPIMPRRLQGISAQAIDLRTKLLEHDLPVPMITCPMGGHGMFHVNAEVATAGGTGAAGTLYVSSGAAHKPMEDIAKATPGPKWFQIYMNRDMEINRWLVQRARAAGFSAIVLTADALGPNQADEYVRLGSFRRPTSRRAITIRRSAGAATFRDFKRDLSFSDIGFLREASGLPVIVKGIVHAEDIRESHRGRRRGAIWVSNHGGRQIDGVPASITMLRPAADAVARPRADHLRQRHPARHRCVQGAGARRHRGRGRPPGAVGPDRRRRAGRQERLCPHHGRDEGGHAALRRRQGDRDQARARGDAEGIGGKAATPRAPRLGSTFAGRPRLLPPFGTPPPLPLRGNCAKPRTPDRTSRLEGLMADHGHVEYATAQGNDLPAHVATYDRFIHMTLVGSCHVASVVIALAIGAVAHHWLAAFAILILATLVAVHGFMSGARTPSMVMVVISLLTSRSRPAAEHFPIGAGIRRRVDAHRRGS